MRAVVCGANGAMGCLICAALGDSVIGKVSIDGQNGVPKTFAQLCKGPGHAVFAVDGDLADDLVTELLADQLAHGAVGAADDGSHFSTPSLRISRRSISSFWGSIWVRGRRRRFSQ